ncbi:MAG: site-specific integrase [Bacteroidaceae bacterium]|nr:site-specific integrase [Bacteroidaceae bacterium]
METMPYGGDHYAEKQSFPKTFFVPISLFTENSVTEPYIILQGVLENNMAMKTYELNKTKAYQYGGTLFHRVRGKYLSANTPDAGPFYYRYVKPDGTVFAKCLETEDRYEAASIAKGIYLALSKNVKDNTSPRIEDVWDRYEMAEQNISEASMDDYKQIFRRFVKWTRNKAPTGFRGCIKYAEDVTTELCRDYAREVCASKTTGMRDISILREIWNLVFPMEDENPWNVGIKPKVKPRTAISHSRMISLDEARRLREAILREAEEWSGKDEEKRSKVLTPDFLADFYDAVAFAWWYGMRVGSLASLNWKDFKYGDEWFLHIPPKTEKSSCNRPLQLPIVPEIDEIINRRRAESTSEWLFPTLHAQYNKRGMVKEREHGYEIKRSANRTGQAEMARDLKKLFQKAGINDDFNGRASMHGFRKATTNMLEANGESIYLIRSILGWKMDSAEDHYINGQTVERKRAALLKAIEPLAAPKIDRSEIERIIDEL